MIIVYFRVVMPANRFEGKSIKILWHFTGETGKCVLHSSGIIHMSKTFCYQTEGQHTHAVNISLTPMAMSRFKAILH